ncbi:DUF58 domain-containing protein [Mobilicoccus pelagius]|uniref:DUF58 domain-containing protein n=1 Tax=Mobilicoccus pelagius NBRC 104925 TaxID=1089455 RepID=H5UQH5_9MICO|nr:DUF58 domain-containing protein [Mobilicoccus pelagius]GAB47983.1 hypothetical protein MOPEL_032_00250 [Mobilicoccus pelagius NBRC 104925]
MRPRLTGRGSALLGGGLALAVGGPLLGVPDLTRWGLFALGLVACAALSVTLCRPGVEVEVRPSPGTTSVGRSTTLALAVTAHRPTRTHPISVAIPPALTGGTPCSSVLVDDDLGPTETLDLTLRLRPTRRGLHRIPPATIDVVDPLCLARTASVVGTPTDVLVAPRLHDLDALPGAAVSTRPGSAVLSAAATPAGGVPASARPYSPGDDLRRIHWPMSAHRGELMVRQEEPEGRLHVTLVLDPWLADGRHPARFEWGIDLLASVVVACDEAGADVSLVVAGPGPTSVAAGPATPTARRSEGSVADIAAGTSAAGTSRAGALRPGPTAGDASSAEAEVGRVLGVGRDACLRALALAPTRPPGRGRRTAPPASPTPEGQETTGPEQSGSPRRARDVSARTVLDHAGWVLQVTGSHASDGICSSLDTLAPGTAATVVVVADSSVATAGSGGARGVTSRDGAAERGPGLRRRPTTAPPLEDGDEAATARVVAGLRAAGAHVVVVSERTPHAEAWRQALAPLEDARVGGWLR